MPFVTKNTYENKYVLLTSSRQSLAPRRIHPHRIAGCDCHHLNPGRIRCACAHFGPQERPDDRHNEQCASTLYSSIPNVQRRRGDRRRGLSVAWRSYCGHFACSSNLKRLHRLLGSKRLFTGRRCFEAFECSWLQPDRYLRCWTSRDDDLYRWVGRSEGLLGVRRGSGERNL